MVHMMLFDATHTHNRVQVIGGHGIRITLEGSLDFRATLNHIELLLFTSDE